MERRYLHWATECRTVLWVIFCWVQVGLYLEPFMRPIALAEAVLVSAGRPSFFYVRQVYPDSVMAGSLPRTYGSSVWRGWYGKPRLLLGLFLRGGVALSPSPI